MKCFLHGCKTKIIPYAIIWDGTVGKQHFRTIKLLKFLSELKRKSD